MAGIKSYIDPQTDISEEGSLPLRNQKLMFAISLILILIPTGVAFYFYRQADYLKKNPQIIAQEEVRDVIQKVEKLIVLPENEAPALITVVDPEALKDQPFFARAKVGDKVLVYTNARKAILYDPVQNKILEVAVLNIGQQ